MKYAGLDVHDGTVVICVVDAAGRTLHTAIVPTHPRDILQSLRTVRGPLSVALEEGTLAGWLCAELRGRVHAVIVCDPRRNRMLCGGSRNDRIDAARIAELLRVGALRPVYHGDLAVETLRTLAHHYDALTRDVVRVKMRLRAAFRSRGITSDGTALFRGSDRRRYLKRLRRRPADYLRAEALFRQLDVLAGLKAEAQAALVAEAATGEAFVLLQSFPYVGPVRAALFQAMVGAPGRFANRRRFWRYAGFAVRHVGSGEHSITGGTVRRLPNKVRTCGLDRRCNYVLKRVLREIACGVATGRGCMRAIYDRAVARGKPPAVARLALARRIAATLLAIWRSGRPFDPTLAARSLRREEASLNPFTPRPTTKAPA